MKKFNIIIAPRNTCKFYDIRKKIDHLESDRSWIQCYLYNYEPTEPLPTI